jgi:hypothetical protein
VIPCGPYLLVLAIHSGKGAGDHQRQKHGRGCNRSKGAGTSIELRRHGSILLAMSWKMTGSSCQRAPVPGEFRSKCNANWVILFRSQNGGQDSRSREWLSGKNKTSQCQDNFRIFIPLIRLY